jgi:hypothetical protein
MKHTSKTVFAALLSIVLIGSISYPVNSMGVIEDDHALFPDDQVVVSEIEVPGGVVLNIPPSESNTSSIPQIINTSFFYQGQELYLAVEFYLPNQNGTCGGGVGNGDFDFDDLLTVSPPNQNNSSNSSSISSSSSSAEGAIIKDIKLTPNKTGFIQTIILPNDDVLCAKGGIR